ncbi:phosphate ABC transporter permease subunit PstC [Candidatus Planktophila dulcis]|uniref:phosphate ABC transporter permease subunit PstC n=1 Tax=Candidatus Planktophila dulcis TaxID=1884914 RepID=UPI003BEEF1D7
MSIELSERPAPPAPREITTQPRRSDQIFRIVVTIGGMASLVILGLIALFLSIKGLHILTEEKLGFITGSAWEVITDDTGSIAESKFGIGAMLVGTFLSAMIAILVGVPISVLSALYLTFYANGKVKKFLISVIDLMAAFPSLLFGFWGFFVFMSSAEYWAKLINKYLGFIPFFDVPTPIFERSPFIAGLVLAIMIIPIVTSISREIFDQTPLDRIQAAYALGATRLAMIKAVVIPFGRGGIIGGAMLGLGRAMGETVAVYTVLNVVYQINWQILFGAGGNVASLILLKFGEAGPAEVDALMAAGLVLFILTLLVNAVADLLINRFGGKGR